MKGGSGIYYSCRIEEEWVGGGGGGVINLFKSEEQAGLSRAELKIYSVIS